MIWFRNTKYYASDKLYSNKPVSLLIIVKIRMRS